MQSAALNLNGQFLTPAEVKQVLIDTGDFIVDQKVAITKPRINLGRAIDAITCFGKMLFIYNDGGATLDVNDIVTPPWVSLSPGPPYSIAGGSRQGICVEVDCNSCNGDTLIGLLEIYSNDPAKNPYPGGVIVNTACTPILLTSDFDNDLDVDLVDFYLLAQQWLTTSCADPALCPDVDINSSGMVDVEDLIIFAGQWLEGKGPP